MTQDQGQSLPAQLWVLLIGGDQPMQSFDSPGRIDYKN
jgi:hypothetical protein